MTQSRAIAVKFCAYGATTTSRTDGIIDAYVAAVTAVRRLIASQTGAAVNDVDMSDWNDRPEQTADGVASTLRAAALDATDTPGEPPPTTGRWRKMVANLKARTQAPEQA